MTLATVEQMDEGRAAIDGLTIGIISGVTELVITGTIIATIIVIDSGSMQLLIFDSLIQDLTLH